MTNKINEKLFMEACKVYNFKIDIFSKMSMADCIEKASFELCNFFQSYIQQYFIFYGLNDNHVNLITAKEIQNSHLQRAVNCIQTDWMIKEKKLEYIQGKKYTRIFRFTEERVYKKEN